MMFDNKAALTETLLMLQHEQRSVLDQLKWRQEKQKFYCARDSFILFSSEEGDKFCIR